MADAAGTPTRSAVTPSARGDRGGHSATSVSAIARIRNYLSGSSGHHSTSGEPQRLQQNQDIRYAGTPAPAATPPETQRRVQHLLVIQEAAESSSGVTSPSNPSLVALQRDLVEVALYSLFHRVKVTGQFLQPLGTLLEEGTKSRFYHHHQSISRGWLAGFLECLTKFSSLKDKTDLLH